MAKFYGKVGFVHYEETEGSVYKEVTTEREYYGDSYKLSRRYESSDKVNDNLMLSDEISIVADAFAYENFQSLRYVNYMGANWKVSSARVERPRIIMQIGGVYNGEEGPQA